MDGELHLGEPEAELLLDPPPDPGHLPHVGDVAHPHLHPVLLAAHAHLNTFVRPGVSRQEDKDARSFKSPTCDDLAEVVSQRHQQRLHPPLVQSGGSLALLEVQHPAASLHIGRVLPVRHRALLEHGVGVAAGKLAGEFDLKQIS